MTRITTPKNYSIYILGTAISILALTSCSTDDSLITDDLEALSSSNLSAISSNGPSDGKTYYIKSLHSDKYLDVADFSTDNGGKIHQWNYTGAENQQWEVSSVGNYYTLTSVLSGKVMEAAGNNTSNGTQIQQWKYVGSDFQKFTFDGNSLDGYEMKVVASNKVIDIASFSTNNGGTIHQWTDNNTINQKWEFIEVVNPVSTNVASSSFINTNDGVFNLDDFQIESSSHLSSSTSKTTTSWSYDDNEFLGSEWYYISNGDYYLKSADYDGKRTEFKEFSGNERSLDVEKVFKYEASVDDIPENGVTIAQVHNRGGVKRPFLRVYIEHGNIDVKETTNDLTNSSGTYYTGHGPEYIENTKFKVQITTGNGKVNVKIETTSGTFSEDFTPNTSVDGYDDYKDDFYLKAGVYTEGNDTDPLIRFYSVEL